MRWADWGAGGAPALLNSIWRKHPLFQRDPEGVARGVPFILPQPHRDEMLPQSDRRPSQNNSRKCQTSVCEMRPGEVSTHFSVQHRFPLPSLQTPQAVRQDEDKWPTKTPWHLKEHAAMYTCWTASRSTFCHAWWWTVLLTETSHRHSGCLRIACDSCKALQATRTAQTGTQHPPDAAQTGGTSTLAPNTKMRICSCHQASSYFDVTSTLPYKHSTYI